MLGQSTVPVVREWEAMWVGWVGPLVPHPHSTRVEGGARGWSGQLQECTTGPGVGSGRYMGSSGLSRVIKGHQFQGSVRPLALPSAHPPPPYATQHPSRPRPPSGRPAHRSLLQERAYPPHGDRKAAEGAPRVLHLAGLRRHAEHAPPGRAEAIPPRRQGVHAGGHQQSHHLRPQPGPDPACGRGHRQFQPAPDHRRLHHQLPPPALLRVVRRGGDEDHRLGAATRRAPAGAPPHPPLAQPPAR
eukprot:765856-Hanusia_phi.AAC.5